MYDQARYKPYGASEFFEDGTSARPLVAGTIPRRDPRERDVTSTEVFETGMAGGKLVDELPFPVDRAVLERGQERFRIFCTPCHGELGDGQGMIVRRGFNPPPSYHTQELRDKPIGHYFDVMTRGYGTMYSYAARVPARDRWAIAAYIRALQLSQHAPDGRPPRGRPHPAPGRRPMSTNATCLDDELRQQLDRVQTTALVVGVCRPRTLSGCLAAPAGGFLSGISGGVPVLAGNLAGMHRAHDAPPPDGRLVGAGRAAAARGRRGHGRRSWHWRSCRSHWESSPSIPGPPGQPSVTSTLLEKHPYLNETFFFIRAAIYFAVWIAMALIWTGQSGRQDATADHGPSRSVARALRPGCRHLVLDRHLLGDRLGDVARSRDGRRRSMAH